MRVESFPPKSGRQVLSSSMLIFRSAWSPIVWLHLPSFTPSHVIMSLLRLDKVFSSFSLLLLCLEYSPLISPWRLPSHLQVPAQISHPTWSDHPPYYLKQLLCSLLTLHSCESLSSLTSDTILAHLPRMVGLWRWLLQAVIARLPCQLASWNIWSMVALMQTWKEFASPSVWSGVSSNLYFFLCRSSLLLQVPCGSGFLLLTVAFRFWLTQPPLFGPPF